MDELAPHATRRRGRTARWRRIRLLGGAALVALAATGCLPTPLVWIDTYAGTGSSVASGDGGPALAAGIPRPRWMAVDDGGAVYVTDTETFRIRRIDPDGTISTIAGTGTRGFTGDGGPATEAQISTPWAPTIGPDGALLFYDIGSRRLRRIDAGGTITTVAGDGVYGATGDGGPATAAALGYVTGTAVAPDGTIYLADSDFEVVRRIDPDGTITTIAGAANEHGFAGDGGPAEDALLYAPAALALDSQGNLYVGELGNLRVRRIATDGTITTVAGNGQFPPSSTATGIASEAPIYPDRLAVDGNDDVLVTERAVVRIILVEADIVTTYAGTGTYGYAGDGGDPLEAELAGDLGVAVAPNGDVYVADHHNHRIRAVRTGGAIGGQVAVEEGTPEGLVVDLYAAGDRTTPIMSTTTDDAGDYGFRVRPGDYVLRFPGDETRAGEWWGDAVGPDDAQVITIERGTRFRADASLAGP